MEKDTVPECSVQTSTGRWILAATIIASGMAFLIGSAVFIALPTIQSDFNTSITNVQWVVSAFMLTLASLILISGSLGDRYGRKRVFLWGIGVFTLGSILSGIASTVAQLIGFQVIQGIGAAMMIPGSLAIINSCFAEDHRGQAIGLWVGLSGVFAALGPLAGGWLVEHISWRAIFFLLVPLGLVALIITHRFVIESRQADKGRLDWMGTLLVILGLLGIATGFLMAPSLAWTHPLVLLGLIGGVLALCLFVYVELRHDYPIVPLKIFSNPLVAGANLVTLGIYFGLNGVIFMLTLNLQQVQGYTPTEAGLGLLPPIVIITFFAGPAGSLTDRIGPRLPMIIGSFVVALGIGLLIIPGTEANYFTGFLPGLTLFGSGMALVIAPLTKSALSVAPPFSGAASGVNNAVSRTAALMAVAILGAVLLSLFSGQLETRISAADLIPQAKEQILDQADKLADIELPAQFNEASRIIARKAIDDSFVYGYRWAMATSTILVFLGFLVSVVTIRSPSSGTPDVV